MEVIKRRKEFLIDIRRKRKKEFFYNNRENIKNNINQNKVSPQNIDFIKAYDNFMKLENGDVRETEALSEQLKDLSFDYLTCSKQIINLQFVDKIFFIISSIPTEIAGIDCIDSIHTFRQVFKNLCNLLYNLMCEIQFRKVMGLLIFKKTEEFILDNLKHTSVDFTILFKVFSLSIDESPVLTWVINDSKLVKSVFSADWNIKQVIDENNYNPFFIEKCQIFFTNEIILSLLNLLNDNHQIDSKLIKDFLIMLDKFLLNLKEYFDFLKVQPIKKEDQEYKNVKINLEYWELEINKKIVNTLTSIYFAIKNSNLTELNDIEIILVHYDINILIFGLDFASVLKDSSSLNKLLEILEITLNNEDPQDDLILNIFQSIDIMGSFIQIYKNFNINQVIFVYEYIDTFLSFFINEDSDVNGQLLNKIPKAILTPSLDLMNVMMNPITAQDIEFDLAEKIISFLQTYIQFLTPDAFLDFIDSQLTHLIALFEASFESRDENYINLFIDFIFDICCTLVSLEKFNSNLKNAFNNVIDHFHSFVNQDLYINDLTIKFEYNEQSLDKVLNILVILDQAQ